MRAVKQLGRILDRLAAGYEADPAKRHDLRQEIHLQLWRSLAVFDGRCSLKTWVLRVAYNTAVSFVTREKRLSVRFVSLEEVEGTRASTTALPDLDPGEHWIDCPGSSCNSSRWTVRL